MIQVCKDQCASCVAKSGGNYDNGSMCGVFYLAVNNAPSNANANNGSHLQFPKIFKQSRFLQTLPLGKTSPFQKSVSSLAENRLLGIA